jgi:serine/threonine-protein kinase
MTGAVAAGGGAAAGPGIAPGQVVGGRFELIEPASEDALGAVWKARDQKTKKGIALRILAPTLFATPADLEALRAELKIASALVHRNVVTTFGMGGEKTGARFVACEWLDGKTVAEMRAGPRPPLAQIVEILSQLCEGLSVLHVKSTCHGAVRPSVVWVNGGKAKIADVGIARAILKTGGAAVLGANEQLSLAPEVRASGAAATAKSDVFGIGGVLYALATGRAPTDDFVPPSSAHPEGSPELDTILMRCLAADPAQRFGGVMEVKRALGNLVGKDASIEIDIDVEEAKRRSQMPPAARPAGGETPQVGQRVSIHEEFRPSLVGAPPPAQASAMVDLGKIISKITENDAARWMAQKDGLDHGPFSGRELVGLIAKGEVLGDHVLLNMDTGERRKTREYPEFLEFVEQYKIKAHAQAEKVAIVESAKTERASNTAKFLIAAAVLGVVGIVLGVFFYTRGAEQSHDIASADLADMYARGEIPIEGTAGVLPDPPRRSGGHGGVRRSGSAGGTSYEDAMSQVVDMGSATGSGGEGRLSPAQVAGVMNGRINSFFPCVGTELRSGGHLGRVRINVAIAGNGSVLGSSVDSGSPAFQGCIQRVVAGIHFPSFGAPRMGASFAFDASQ